MRVERTNSSTNAEGVEVAASGSQALNPKKENPKPLNLSPKPERFQSESCGRLSSRTSTFLERVLARAWEGGVWRCVRDFMFYEFEFRFRDLGTGF